MLSPHGRAGHLQKSEQTENGEFGTESKTPGSDIQSYTNTPHQEGTNSYPHAELSSLEMLPSEPVLFKSYCREHLGFRQVHWGGMESMLQQHRYLWPELLEPERPRAWFRQQEQRVGSYKH